MIADTVVLAFETSSAQGSVALLRALPAPQSPGHAQAASYEIALHTGSQTTSPSTWILPAAQSLLKDAGLTLADCTALAFSAGPGAFTGLRLATGIVQGLGYGLQIPVIPVSTLLACAEAARTRQPGLTHVLTVMDARMAQVYWAAYHWAQAQQHWQIIHAAQLADPADVQPFATPFTLAGNAANVYGAQLTITTAAGCTVDADALPSARAIAQLGWQGLQTGQAICAQQAMPYYVRDKVALTITERQALAGIAKAL